jgi:hypothetical protein
MRATLSTPPESITKSRVNLLVSSGCPNVDTYELINKMVRGFDARGRLIDTRDSNFVLSVL